MSETTRRRLGGLAAAGLVALTLGACAQTKDPGATAAQAPASPPAATKPAAKEVPANDGMNATYWTQNAVEFKANSYGLYMLAKLRLDQALADRSWTALPGEQGTDYRRKPPAVILDIDETVLDNSEYQAWTVKTGQNFGSKTWTEFVNAETGRAIPGSLEFIKYAQSKKVAIFYISNRKDIEEKATISNLKKLGYPVDDAGATVLTRGEKEEWKASAKSPRRKAVAATHRVLLNIGDNLGDFTDESDTSPAQRMEVYRKHQDRWGRDWIMIANPTYGSWEGAAFGFNWKLSDAEKRQKKLDGMDAWKGPAK